METDLGSCLGRNLSNGKLFAIRIVFQNSWARAGRATWESPKNIGKTDRVICLYKLTPSLHAHLDDRHNHFFHHSKSSQQQKKFFRRVRDRAGKVKSSQHLIKTSARAPRDLQVKKQNFGAKSCRRISWRGRRKLVRKSVFGQLRKWCPNCRLMKRLARCLFSTC
jgi:hypothetical protein